MIDDFKRDPKWWEEVLRPPYAGGQQRIGYDRARAIRANLLGYNSTNQEVTREDDARIDAAIEAILRINRDATRK